MKPIDGYDRLCAYCVVLFVVFLFCVLLSSLFVFMFCWHGGSLAPNVDIVRFRCGGGVATLPAKSFSCFWGGFVLFWSTLISCTLAISLYMSVSAK